MRIASVCASFGMALILGGCGSNSVMPQAPHPPKQMVALTEDSHVTFSETVAFLHFGWVEASVQGLRLIQQDDSLPKIIVA